MPSGTTLSPQQSAGVELRLDSGPFPWGKLLVAVALGGSVGGACCSQQRGSTVLEWEGAQQCQGWGQAGCPPSQVTVTAKSLVFPSFTECPRVGKKSKSPVVDKLFPTRLRMLPKKPRKTSAMTTFWEQHKFLWA